MSVDVAPQPTQKTRTRNGSGRRRTDYEPPATVVLGSNVSIEGILYVDGALQVGGRLEADVRCASLLIGPHGHVDGVVVAKRVVVDGYAAGEIYADQVIIRDGAHVLAELYYNSLTLEPGGLFDGRSRRYPNPISMAPSFAGG